MVYSPLTNAAADITSLTTSWLGLSVVWLQSLHHVDFCISTNCFVNAASTDKCWLISNVPLCCCFSPHAQIVNTNVLSCQTHRTWTRLEAVGLWRGLSGRTWRSKWSEMNWNELNCQLVRFVQSVQRNWTGISVQLSSVTQVNSAWPSLRGYRRNEYQRKLGRKQAHRAMH